MENEISILEENSIRSKIHVIRGQQVMLDFDLAQIYGYETKNFNRQVKNNIERFDSDFMFQLTNTKMEEFLRCKNFTLNKGRGSNIKYAPYAFTEQGIYMLMTVLKSDLAVTQSKMLIRTFKEMKHFIQNNSHISSCISSNNCSFLLANSVSFICSGVASLQLINENTKQFNIQTKNSFNFIKSPHISANSGIRFYSIKVFV